MDSAEDFKEYVKICLCYDQLVILLRSLIWNRPCKQILFNRLGNKAFAAQAYDEAISCYTEAIKLDSRNHIYFSNRRYNASISIFTILFLKYNCRIPPFPLSPLNILVLPMLVSPNGRKLLLMPRNVFVYAHHL